MCVKNLRHTTQEKALFLSISLGVERQPSQIEEYKGQYSLTKTSPLQRLI